MAPLWTSCFLRPARPANRRPPSRWAAHSPSSSPNYKDRRERSASPRPSDRSDHPGDQRSPVRRFSFNQPRLHPSVTAQSRCRIALEFHFFKNAQKRETSGFILCFHSPLPSCSWPQYAQPPEATGTIENLSKNHVTAPATRGQSFCEHQLNWSNLETVLDIPFRNDQGPGMYWRKTPQSVP